MRSERARDRRQSGAFFCLIVIHFFGFLVLVGFSSLIAKVVVAIIVVLWFRWRLKEPFHAPNCPLAPPRPARCIYTLAEEEEEEEGEGSPLVLGLPLLLLRPWPLPPPLLLLPPPPLLVLLPTSSLGLQLQLLQQVRHPRQLQRAWRAPI
jgi:hypothetical protein